MSPEELKTGDVISIELSLYDGVHPKNGFQSRRKYFVVLGICNGYALLGGIVINSNINTNLSKRVQDNHIRVLASEYPFLKHDSFFDCSTLIKPRFSRLESAEMLGKVTESHLSLILTRIKRNPAIPRMELQMFGI